MAFPQPLTSVPIVDSDLRPSLSWRLYLPRLDAAIRGLVGTTTFSSELVQVATPTNANAAAAGVAIGQLYRDTANPANVYVRTE